MKVISETLKNIQIATAAGKFQVNGNGVADVPDDVAKELIADGIFAKADKAVEPKAIKADDKGDAEEAKEDSKKK